MKFPWRDDDERRRAERVSRAVHLPGMEWDRPTREIASMARLLEPAVAPSETAREKAKAQMLAAFAEVHGAPGEDAPRPVVIADIEAVSEQEAVEVAERFAQMLAARRLTG